MQASRTTVASPTVSHASRLWRSLSAESFKLLVSGVKDVTACLPCHLRGLEWFTAHVWATQQQVDIFEHILVLPCRQRRPQRTSSRWCPS